MLRYDDEGPSLYQVMPLSYITDASQRLKDETQKYLDKNSNTLDLYEAVVDEEFILDNSIVLAIGDLVRIVSPPFDIDNTYEIKELTQLGQIMSKT